MLQRIQTVYLAIATILTSSLFYLKLAILSDPDSLYTMFYNGIFRGESNTGDLVLDMTAFVILMFVSVILGVITILLYKKRMLQIRLAGLNIGLQAGLTVLIYYFAQYAGKELDAVYSFNYAMVFPVIAIIFLILAIKSIGKDEALIRSLDRIR